MAVSFPLSANLAMAPLGVAFEAWPPVLLYISLGTDGGKTWWLKAGEKLMVWLEIYGF